MAESILNLTIGERLAALQIFDAFKGSISTLSALMDDVKLFPVTSEEWEKAKLVKTPTDEELSALPQAEKANIQQQWKWNEEGSEKEIKVQSATLDYLKGEITKKSDTGEITLKDVALVSLQKKL